MEIKEKYYQYADKGEQLKRANQFLVTGSMVFYLAILIITWISVVRGLRTAGYAGMITVIVLLAAAFLAIMYRLDHGSALADRSGNRSVLDRHCFYAGLHSVSGCTADCGKCSIL